MAIGNVNSGQRVESASQLGDCRVVGNRPKLMAHAIIGRDIDFRFAGGRLRQHGVNRRRIRIAAHHGTGLGIDGLNLPNTIIFFCWRRVLVLSNAIDRIVLKRGNGGQTRLNTVTPSEPIDIVARLVVAG